MTAPVAPVKRLTRSRTDRKLLGVCGGLAEYLGLDPTLVRVLWVVLSIFPGTIIGGVIVYLLCFFIIPEGPEAAPPPTLSPYAPPTPPMSPP